MVYFSMISNGKKENKVMLIIFQVVNSQSQIILNNRYKFYKQPELEEETRFAYFPASTMVILDTESEFPNFLFWKQPWFKIHSFICRNISLFHIHVFCC